MVLEQVANSELLLLPYFEHRDATRSPHSTRRRRERDAVEALVSIIWLQAGSKRCKAVFWGPMRCLPRVN